MLKFLLIIFLVFILFGVFRRMMFGSFYAAMKKHQKDLHEKEEEERKRKREGKVVVGKIDKSNSDNGDYIDYEEIK